MQRMQVLSLGRELRSYKPHGVARKIGGGGGASLAAQRVKNLPAIQETWVRFLGQEDPLEKEMAAHSSILAWEISWTEEPGRLQSMGIQKSWTRLSN